MRHPRLLLIGHGRHGKDTAAEYLEAKYGMKFTSSSWFCAQEVLWDAWGCAVYDSIEEMFEDRVNHRVLWMQMISAYNTPNKAKTAETMIERGFDMYVGMRRLDELQECRRRFIFDKIIWVDRSEHLPPEVGSTDLRPEHADVILDNNGTLVELGWKVDELLKEHVVPFHMDKLEAEARRATAPDQVRSLP